MGKIYSVEVTIERQLEENLILEILEKGEEIGFKYYDYILGERYEDSPLLNPKQAFKKYKELSKIPDDPHSLYVEIAPQRYAYLSFWETEDGFFKYDLGAFGNCKYRDTEDYGEVIDFQFYIEIACQLGEKYRILKIFADTF